MKRAFRISVFFIACLTWLIFSPSLFSQVLTPSFDPTSPVHLFSASPWRRADSIGGSYDEGNGTRSLNNEEIYQFSSTGFSAMGAFKIANFSVEAFSSDFTNNVSLNQYYQGAINTKRNVTRGGISILGNEFVSIGLGTRTIESQDYISGAYPNETSKSSSNSASLAIAVSENIFFGGGLEKVKSSSSYTVENNWNDVTGAVALRFGEFGGTRFRLELSSTNSPSSVKEGNSIAIASNHPNIVTTRVEAELMFSGLLFALKSHSMIKKIDETNESTQEVISQEKSANSEFGVVWVPETGALLGFYFVKNQVVQVYEDDFSEFKIKLGWVF